MKKAFVAILSLAALVACSQDVTLQRNDSAAISFDNFIEKKTRVATDPSTTTESLSEFSVWGFRGESSALVLQEERVYKTAEGWVYDNLQYWNEGADYFFAAVSPVKHSQVEVDATGLCKTGLGTITFTNTAAGDVDLIYASKLIDKSDVDASNPEKVKLQFAHLLSKVKFSIAYDFPNALTTVAVKDLKIANSPAVGTIDLTKERSSWMWTLPQTGETVTLEFGDIEKGDQFPLVNEYYESDKECLLIPADATRSYTITFMVEVYNNGVLAGEYPKTITLTNRAFVQGKNYNLKTIITPDNIVEGGLKPIEFEVIEVEAWDDPYTDVDLDGEQTEEPAEPTVLATPAVKTSVDVNVVTLTWDAVEGAAYYTVQVDDDIAEKVEGTSYVFEGDYAVEYMFTVVAVPAEGENLVASEAAVVTATTEAKPEEPVTPEPTETVLYLQPNANWNVDNARFAAYFFGNGETWVNMTLVEGETNIYAVTVPQGYASVIFCRMNPTATANNWDNRWNQTNDLNVPTDGTNLYVVADGAWSNGNGSWTTYAPATEEPVEPETPAAGSEITVAKFLEMADTANEFVLTGEITRVVNETYGNFDLTDATGTIYIYGLLTPEGTAQQQWAAAGLRQGDTVTVKGVYNEYNGTAQVKNAIYVSHVAAPFVSAEPVAINADDTAATIVVKSNVAWTVSCDADWVTSYTTSGANNGEIAVVAAVNALASNRTATFTISGEGVADFTVTLTQYAAGAVDTKGTYTSEDFLKGGTSTSGKYYMEKVNVAGTQYDCLKLGTSSVVGDYTTKAVNEAGDLTLSFYAVGWNGKTSKLNVYVDGVKVGETLTLKANSGAANNSPYTITPSDDTDYYSISLTGVSESSKIKFETVSGSTRAIIFGVQLY